MFYDQLVVLCKENNISVSGITKQLGMSPGTISKWKDGIIPNGETVLKFAQYFNVSTDYLLTGNLQTSDLCDEEKELLQRFRSLPYCGKEKVKSYIDGYISAMNISETTKQ